jgi:hypothetical protein
MPRSMVSSQRGLRDPLPIFQPMPFIIGIREAIGLSASWASDHLRVAEVIGGGRVVANNFRERNWHGGWRGEFRLNGVGYGRQIKSE